MNSARASQVVSWTEGLRRSVVELPGGSARLRATRAVDRRPLLEHIVLTLRSAGVVHFVMIPGYRAETIKDHFGDGARLGVEILYRRQEVRDGTARALLLARDAIDGRDFLLGWGDILA